MKVIVPHKLDLLSCSIAESDSVDGTVWSASATYSLGARVRHEHVSYEGLEGNNKGNNPADTWSGINAKWKKLGPTAPWAMLDGYVETQTKSQAGQTLSFCVPFDRADAFAFLNMSGHIARARIYDLDEPTASQLVWESESSLIADIYHVSLYEYNYLPIVSKPHMTATDLPMVMNGKLCVEIEPGEGDSAAIGEVVAGRAHQLGYTKYDAELGFTDYSRKTTDEFGVTTLVRRSFASRASLPVYLHPDQFDYAAQTLESVRGTPCLWIGDNTDTGFAALTIYGWLEDFRMVIAGPNEIQLSLEIQGLI